MGKVIISCAVTGSIHTPTMSPYLPITPEEIATIAIEAAEAGAAILPLHARKPEDGSPTPDPEVFRQFLPRIKESCSAVINITTGGATTMTSEERIAGPLAMQPEMCSLNMGSMNFGMFQALNRFDNWKHDWEVDYLDGSRDRIFRNTFTDIETILRRMGECGTRFECECYDIGHLYTLAHCVDQGLIQPPLFIQSIFGILGGVGADPENLMHARRIANKLFGKEYQWSILAPGRFQTSFVTMGAMMGSHVRVGLEDSLYLSKGVLAESNAQQVAKIRRILGELSLEVATADEAREVLDLKGGENVRF